MTGFAKLETESTEGKLYGEARALNSRYLEISIKLPRADFLHEQKLRELVKRHIKRGKVDITIKWERPNEQAGAQKINENVLVQYVETAKTLKEKYALKGDLTIDNIFSFKDIFSYEENNNINEDMLMQSFEKLIAQLNQEREKEGDLIKKDLMARANAIVSNVAAIEERWPLTIKMLENRLRERITEIIASSSVDETRVLQAGANLSKTTLDKANLKDAELSGVILSGASLSGTIWRNGSKCLEGSAGECMGDPARRGGTDKGFAF